MDVKQFEALAMLRTVVGFLGERDQYGWWPSSFFAAQSRAFLAPMFSRTQLLAQYTGVTRAASLVHDDRIGVGRVFHLFRLPEDIEQAVHQALHQPEVARRVATTVMNKEAALQYLQDLARTTSAAAVGPTRASDAHSLRETRTWRTIAAQYAHAFTADEQVFPFFTDQR